MKRTIFSIHPMIRNTLLIIPLLLVLSVYFLKHGISIGELKLGQFQVQGLYLKLDKKIVAKIDYLSLPKKNKDKDFSQLEASLDRIKWLPKYFQSVVLDRVDVNDRQFRIIYKDNIIYVSNDEYEIAGMLERKMNLVEGSLSFVWIKKYNLRLSGKFKYEYKKEIFALDADFVLENQIKGHILAKYGDKKLAYKISTDKFSSSSSLRRFVENNKIALKWFKRIRAKSYRVVSAEGVLSKKGNSFQIEPMSIKADLELKNASVVFNPKLKKVKLDVADVKINKNVLYVKAPHPSYDKKALDGSSFYLANLLGNKPKKIHLKIKTKTRYDKTVQRVIKAYKLKLPISQKTGSVRADVEMDIVPQKNIFKINGSAVLGKGRYLLYGTPLKILGGRVSFDKHSVKLNKVDADFSWLRGKVSGTLKLVSKKAKLSVDLKSLSLGDKKSPFVSIKNKHKIPVVLDWKKRFRIEVPLYKTVIAFGKNKSYKVSIADIRPLLPYAKGLPISIKSGHLSINTKNGKVFSYSGIVNWPASYLYDKKGTIKKFPISGQFSNGSTTLRALKGKIKYSSPKSLIQISNLYINGKKMIEGNKKRSSKSAKFRVKGTKSLIRYDKYVLLTDRFDFRSNGKHKLFTATKDGDTVRVEMNGDAIVIKANRIKAPMLRALIHFGGLSGGRYSLDLHGRINGTMKGVITVKGGVASSFKTYNNMIALFNTVPALSSLSDPGFSKKGFEIQDGRIEFGVAKNRVYFDMIYINGKTAAISGKGTVSTVNGAINMDLAVRTARGIGKIIGSIPIVGYILMGKDKSITTGVKVTGTMENPKVETHVVLETLLAPLNMFVRTLQSPAHIINN